MKTRSLPSGAAALLAAAPPRLRVHHELVHDVAARMLDVLQKRYSLAINVDDVLFGAATHDLGKMLVPSELSLPGHAHESAGEAHMLTEGVPASRARFARTHGSSAEDIEMLALDDVLVILADKLWKGHRHEPAEKRLTLLISAHAARPAWDVYQTVDRLFERLSRDGHERVEYQALFSA